MVVCKKYFVLLCVYLGGACAAIYPIEQTVDRSNER